MSAIIYTYSNASCTTDIRFELFDRGVEVVYYSVFDRNTGEVDTAGAGPFPT